MVSQTRSTTRNHQQNAPSFSNEQNTESDLQRIFKKAKVYFEAGQFKQAFPLMERVAQPLFDDPLRLDCGGLDDKEAQFYLASMYRSGQGISQDTQNAKKWYERSANQGNENAVRELENLNVELQVKAKLQEFEKALNSYRIQNYSSAYTSMLRLVDEWNSDLLFQKKLGDKIASLYFRLGFICHKGLGGVIANSDLALKWYTLASALDYEGAKKEIKIIRAEPLFIQAQNLYNSSLYDQAYPLLQQAAEDGLDKAQFYLGQMFREGHGTNQSNEIAFKWYRLAAKQGNPDAQYQLSEMYAQGISVEPNGNKDFKWCQRAANQGIAAAQHKLGTMYAVGDGTFVKVDVKEAAKWFLSAALQGNTDAEYEMGVMTEKGLGVDKNDERAAEFYQAAAQKSHPAAMAALHLLEIKLIKIEAEKKFNEAYSSYICNEFDEALIPMKFAAEHGHAEAQYYLSLMYDKARGTSEDKDLALEWCRKAAEQNHLEAQHELGIRYYAGRGVPQDDNEAMKWLQLPADQGNHSSIEAIEALKSKLKAALARKYYEEAKVYYVTQQYEEAFTPMLEAAKQGTQKHNIMSPSCTIKDWEM